MQKKGLVAWICAPVLDGILVEASRLYPKETGGVFMGYWSKLRDSVVITKLIGPGPGAVHRRHRFRPNITYQQQEIADQYLMSGRRETYLGDWHTHPDAITGRLSIKDRFTLQGISKDEGARASEPLMGIVHGEPSSWAVALWKYDPRPLFWFLPGSQELEVRSYSEKPAA